MKPKSKVEVRMCELAQQLPPLPKKLVDEGFKKFKDVGYTVPRRGRKTEVWCQCCGHREQTRGTLAELTDFICPSCGRKLTLEETLSKYSKYHSEAHWITYIDHFQGIQVARTFEFRRTNSDNNPTSHGVRELFQNWAAPNGREIITSRPYTRSIYGEQFDSSKPYWIAKHNDSYTGQYAFSDTFDISATSTFFSARLLPELKRDGFTRPFISRLVFQGYNYIKVAARMGADKAFVTALKTGYETLALYIADSGVKFPPHVFRIMHRNHYKPKDVKMFCEYIADCVFCGVDTHNAHYVCPADLREAHQKMMQKKARIEGERAMKKKLAAITQAEPKYQKLREAFFGLLFQGNGIKVFTAPSVASIYAEGKAMHHCVFTNGYYESANSLIMFARDAKTGDPLETVEVNLKTFSIAQSRGLQNKLTPQHNDICALVNANMNQIRKCCSVRTTKTA